MLRCVVQQLHMEQARASIGKQQRGPARRGGEYEEGYYTRSTARAKYLEVEVEL